MATAPVKPQQLHNFPISLKWGQTTTTIAGSASSAVASSHHHRSTNHNHRLMTTTMTTSSTVVHDSETESDPEHPQSIIPNRHAPPHRVGSRSARAHRFSFASCSNLLPKVKPEIPQKSEVAGKPDKNVIVLDKNNSNNEESGGGGEEEEDASRPWKLRPRKGIATGNKETAAFHANEQSNNNNNNTNTTQFQPPKSTRLRGLIESSSSGGGGLGLGLGGVSLEKKEKRKFWIALSRDEIEEDIFALTGSRPARRPKKRPKNVQKVLDCVFPGLWLVGTTADSYRVADPPVKVNKYVWIVGCFGFSCGLDFGYKIGEFCKDGRLDRRLPYIVWGGRIGLVASFLFVLPKFDSNA